MENIDVVQVLLTFLGGFGLFLFGMSYMGDGLQKSAGGKMKNMLSALTSKPILGVLVGAGATALVQSSSATTVMIVGFVNAGLMTLKQAVYVIMGANIGTTVTAWIVAMGDWVTFLKPSTIAPLCIIIGAVLALFANKKKVRTVGEIIFGFGTLFLGLDLMGDAVKPLSKLPEVQNLFVILGKNPILGILAGAAVTVLVQSSSASVGILQTLAAASLVPWSSAIYIILGQNIGTTVTAMLSSIGATKNGKRAAVIHLLFNIIGSLVFAVISIAAFQFVVPDLGQILISQTEIGTVHTIFNVLNTLMLFPFAKGIVYLAEKLVTGKDDEDGSELQHLDDRILETPSFAVQNAIKEIARMGEMSVQNARLSMDALLNKDTEKAHEVFEREKVINQLQHGINHYLVKISNLSLSEEERNIVTSLFHSVSDIERVGDHADNIAELAENLINDELEFSDLAKEELANVSKIAIECFEIAIQAKEFDDRDIASRVDGMEKQVDKLEKELRAKHIQRLADNKCSSVSGVVYLSTLTNLERISDHATNIANTVIDGKKIFQTAE